jgi:hypothetical protein
MQIAGELTFTHIETQRRLVGFHGGDYDECRLLGCGTAGFIIKRRFGGSCRRAEEVTLESKSVRRLLTDRHRQML